MSPLIPLGHTDPMRPIRVLHVEDHDFTRATVGASLRSEQCTVVASVPTARDAMRAVNEHNVDCAVIDLNLGKGPNGLDLAHRLRDHHPDIGIVLLTTYRDPRLLVGDGRALPPGTVYLAKDDVRSTSQLREAIDTALDKARLPQRRSAPTLPTRLPLTDTQMEILRMVAEGLTNAEIAQRRGVSTRAVQTALTRILANAQIEPESGVDVRAQLLRYYQSRGGTVGVN
jgi:DNA-binding NarL/FixJ family response regulator